MNIDAFRCMRSGIQLNTLNQQDAPLLAAIEQRNGKKQRALLLIHGFSSSPAVYRLFLPMLSQTYDAVFCPVLIGHAESIDSFAKATADAWLEQVEQTYQHLATQYTRVEVLGLSLGGLLACHLSQRFDLPHLYLLAPAIDLQLSLNNSIKLAKTLNWLGFRRIRAKAGNLYTTERCEIAYRQLPITTIIEMLTLAKQFEFRLPSCPTDLFLGRYDKVVSSKRVADRFADHDHINIHWLANSAHVLPLDGDVDYILECIKQKL
ncbi:Thermostable monoacylglycerol lipase [Legionella massiliensis]|uniref:Thermostable monoacylglycerol lipase n=1 Tax=Legionella massiliensis TaxID=1034943 RepID=A0A078KNS3_9GAMM|nr:YqiA/YcfP family alpha/beta fold hydrolase [Legionella massiliensis]CDZ75995.1 Thermostable monoacylglycerol lipase [Legionella massiliensis]CEE11733.1 Thermostable monoacylglycerol lipase [Legionella massiliensis]